MASYGQSWGLEAVFPLPLLWHWAWLYVPYFPCVFSDGAIAGELIDLYYLGLDNKSVPFEGKGRDREQRETIGTRLWGTTEHWDYNDELTFQWGWFGSGDIRAWAASTEHGYRIQQAPLSPRFGLRAVAFCGDQNPSSHNVGTFNSIYEKGPYFSYAELFARSNLVALQPSVDLKLRKSVSLKLNPAFFWRESTSDGLYNISGSVIVSGLHNNARYIATQASAQLQWKMTRNLTWFTEYGHFFSGEFPKAVHTGQEHQLLDWVVRHQVLRTEIRFEGE